MQVREFSDQKDSVEQSGEQVTDQSAVRAAAVECPECDGDVVTVDREVVCGACGIVVEEQYVDLAPRFQLKHVEKDEDKRGLETASPYFLDPNGSPYKDAPLGVTFPSSRGNWTSDGKDNWVSDKTLDKWGAIKYRQVCRESNSRDNWRTDALQDIKTIGRNSGVPRYVRERATDLFRDADDEGLPGGRMAFESVAVGTVVVAAREAGFTQSIDDIAQWARTPHERACAGARKVRIGLELVDQCPPGRQDAVATVLTRVDVEAFDDELRLLASHLMALADDNGIGPGTPRLTVGASAVYAALKLLGDTSSARRFLTRRELVEAVTPIVELSRKKISRYNCEIVDAFEARHRTLDPSVVLERNGEAD